jgi:ABC-type transport system involved in multi-copper enzyme maturation permease subunit
MSGLLRAEILKLRTATTTLGLTAAMLGLVCLVVLVHALALPLENSSRNDQLHVFSWGGLGVIFAALLGALAITGELRSGTIRPTYLATPRRRRVLFAKLIVGAAAGALYGLVATVLTLGLASAILTARGVPVRIDGGDYAQLVAGWTLAAALWSTLGLGVGALIRSQVTMLIGLTAWLLFVENLLLAQLPEVIRFFPGAAASAMSGTTVTGEVPSEPALLAPVAGALLLAVYAIGTMLASTFATEHRDVQ